MLTFEEYLRVNQLDNKKYTDDKPYTLEDYYFNYSQEYVRYANAFLADDKHGHIYE